MTRRERVARALLEQAGCPVAYADIRDDDKDHWGEKADAAIAAYEAALAEEGMVEVPRKASGTMIDAGTATFCLPPSFTLTIENVKPPLADFLVASLDEQPTRCWRAMTAAWLGEKG